MALPLLYLDAFRRRPAAFLMAAWWRLVGKRVRARARFAPLLGASRFAYPLWQSRQCAPARKASAGPWPQIVALVTTGAREDDLSRTLASLAVQDIPAIAIRSGGRALGMLEEHGWLPREDLWLMPITAGDVLAEGAADAYRDAARTAPSDVIYADDDAMSDRGRRHTPHFKPDWNEELFRHHDYVTGSCIVRFTEGLRDSLAAPFAAHSLVAAALNGGREPGHIRQVLHHRRERAAPSVPSALPGSRDLPRLTVIVPTRNRVDLLRTCLEGLARTDYPEMDILVVDNGSDDPEALDYLAGLARGEARVLQHPGAFNFSAINNRAVRETEAPLLCFLNNDVEVVEPGWLATLASQALRPDVGAVGPQLLYPDGCIQHAGVVLGIGGAAGHAHRFVSPDAQGYFRRHALPQFVSAVTAACMVVRRESFLAARGFDEVDFAVAFNDVDLCLKLRALGLHSLYEPRARLVHHESVSRGLDRDSKGAARLRAEIAALRAKWRTDERCDPYHHPALSITCEQFVIDTSAPVQAARS